jgi:short-subunit dehydrogenase involved in D-alanine esterification of teichoic acids
MGKDPEGLEKDIVESFMVNVVGNVHMFNVFPPLIEKGSDKKVVTITSGIDFVSNSEIEPAGPYAIGKAATDPAVAKFSTQYTRECIPFIGICPGRADIRHYDSGK